MKSILPFVFLFFFQHAFAVTKTWVGGAAGSWSDAANWSPSGVPIVATSPSTGDDIVFDGSITTIITITDYSAQLNTDFWGQLSLINNVTVNISSGSDTYMYFGTGINIEAGSRINVGAATTTIFELGNKAAVANSGLVYGIVEMKGIGTNASTNRKVFTVPNSIGATKISGKLIFSGPSAQLTGANQSNFSIQNGGELEWARDGLALPALTCQNGGIINITGIVTAPLVLSNFGSYLGLIIWNCPSQTGQRIPVVPSVGLLFHVDSVRIVNTGTGSACLGNSPCYSVGHLEVQGGIMQLGNPITTTCGGGYVITSDLKLTGGTLIGNATFTGDAGSAYPMTLPINRDLIITGGTFNLTNRPTGLSPGGAIQLNVGRNIIQTGGSLFSTSSFGSQNNISMTGNAAQTLEITNNFTDVGLAVANTSATLGVTLTNNVTIQPSCYFNLVRGYLKLDNYNFTAPANRFFQSVFTPMPKIVTSGFGKLKLTGITASSTTIFPVAPLTVNSYDPLTITTTASATTNDYSVRVQRGIASGNIYSTKVINRTWIVNGATTVVANSVGLTYQYNDSAKQAGCTSSAQMEEGHFAGGVWNVDPAATLIAPTGSDPYVVGPFYPNSIDSSFAFGNLASILAIDNIVQLSAQKNNSTAVLKWTVNNVISMKQYNIERSADGRHFAIISLSNTNSFNYTDIQLLPGLNYYRIRMIDIDGRSYYSNTVAVLNADHGTGLLSIAPNPVTVGMLYLQIASAVAGKMKVIILDMQGRIISTQNVQVIAGFTSVEKNVTSLAKGTYIIYGVSNNERTKLFRFVKQ